MQRERLGSRLGFILLSAGCAIGCGNVWKFPWMAGQNGGGGFVLIYVLFLILLGLPVMVMEFAMGRAAQASPVRMYQKLQKPKQKWGVFGYLALAGNVCLMAFYTVVTGWMMYYFYKFLVGQHASLGFDVMISNPGINVGFLAIAVALGFFIVSFKLQGGLERITKYMMVVLLLLMVVAYGCAGNSQCHFIRCGRRIAILFDAGFFKNHRRSGGCRYGTSIFHSFLGHWLYGDFWKLFGKRTIPAWGIR